MAATGRAFRAVAKWIFALLWETFADSPFGRQVCGKKEETYIQNLRG